MENLKTFAIMIVFFGLIASPAMAESLFSEAGFFYGVTIGNQYETNVPDDTQKRLPIDAHKKKKKAAATMPGGIVDPMEFYGYTDPMSNKRRN